MLIPCCSWNKVPIFTISSRPNDLALTYLISYNSLHKSSFYTSKMINSFHFQDLHWLFLQGALHLEFDMTLSHYSDLSSNIPSPDPPWLLNEIAFFSLLSIPLPSLIYSSRYWDDLFLFTCLLSFFSALSWIWRLCLVDQFIPQYLRVPDIE